MTATLTTYFIKLEINNEEAKHNSDTILFQLIVIVLVC